MANRMTLRGAKELERALLALPDRVAKRHTFNALRAAARQIQKAARENLIAHGSADTGALVNAVKTSDRKRSKKGSAVVAVGIENKAYQAKRKGSSRPKKVNPKNYAHLVEFGSEHSAAKPFMGPAMDGEGGKALDTILDKLTKAIEKEAKKLGASAPKK
jgi:HK97 gp10 family phage protein